MFDNIFRGNLYLNTHEAEPIPAIVISSFKKIDQAFKSHKRN